MRELLYLFFYRAAEFVVFIVPQTLYEKLFALLASLLYRIDKRHGKVAQVNLDFALGELSQARKEEIIKACYRNLLFNMVDFIRNQRITAQAVEQKVRFENREVIERALNEEKKIILMTAHYGNWELMSLAIGALIAPMSIVGRSLDSQRMNAILTENRERFGIELIDKKGAMRGMIKALSSGRMLGILVDQNTAEEEGILIDFFNKRARHTPAAALLARKMDAVIIPVFILTNSDAPYTIRFYDPIETPKTDDAQEDIRRSVQAQAGVTEAIIREKPDEWFWFHKRWKNQYEEIYS